MTAPVNTALIYGSTRPERLCDAVADWITGRIDAHDAFECHRVDPGDAEAAGDNSARMAAADAFIIVTPEYNHGYPAPLKALIDAHVAEWQTKPVAFVSYGGMSGGMLAVEQLRSVLACLHAVSMRDGVVLPHVWQDLDDSGQLAPARLVEGAAHRMLERLHWWALALREARQQRAYP